jgi:hypothetical protein
MKCLSIAGYFRLPDDFAGTVAEGMRLIADKMESWNPREIDGAVEWDRIKMWDEFWHTAVVTRRYDCIAAVGVHSYDLADGIAKNSNSKSTKV